MAICSPPMYLSNTERERLGVFGYGCDVPSDVIAEAEAALAAAQGGVADSTPKKASRRAAATEAAE